MTIDVASFAARIPKAELHVHLEGTISPDAYVRIAHRNGLDPKDADAIFACHDFPSFLRAFLDVVKALRRPEDFAELATEYLTRSAADNVRHVEFFISPATQRKFAPELDANAMIVAVWCACERARRERGVTSRLIIDMVRNLGEEEALLDVDLAVASADKGVVGIGLGGDERRFPARDFQRAYAKARERGLRRTAHAGEAAGAESIVDAVELLGAERIGHGVAAKGKPEVLALLRGRGVTIDACPTSNRFTAALAKSEVHPLREFLNAGVSVTLSSDDPSFFRTSVTAEYEHAAALGCGVEEITAIAKASFERSFLPASDRQRLVEEVDAYVDGLGITR
ncbi:MAG TPA: adenosine deaminase [Candidatus Eremiobacteraceae bacterium]|nr:adenosine deaminase [Candidatus Eremiobacteraceae bacterium]